MTLNLVYNVHNGQAIPQDQPIPPNNYNIHTNASRGISAPGYPHQNFHAKVGRDSHPYNGGGGVNPSNPVVNTHP